VPNSCCTESIESAAVVVIAFVATVVHFHKFNKNTVVLEKLRISQLLNELPILYEITRFVALFMRISHWGLTIPALNLPVHFSKHILVGSSNLLFLLSSS
jgi:hypothetical protein